jgi:hypothetical protein
MQGACNSRSDCSTRTSSRRFCSIRRVRLRAVASTTRSRAGMATMSDSRFRFAIDRGGTFTDVFAEVRLQTVIACPRIATRIASTLAYSRHTSYEPHTLTSCSYTRSTQRKFALTTHVSTLEPGSLHCSTATPELTTGARVVAMYPSACVH